MGTLQHRRWTVFLLSLPKGKEKASGGYSQGGSNSLFFHPAGDCILPSALCPLASQASGVMCCWFYPHHRRVPPRWVGLKVLTAPLGLWQGSSPTAGSMGWAGDEYMTALGAGIIILIFWSGKESINVPVPKGGKAWHKALFLHSRDWFQHQRPGGWRE